MWERNKMLVISVHKIQKKKTVCEMQDNNAHS